MIKKEIKYFHSDSIDSLFYCVIEHSGIDPFEFIENLVSDLSILILELDGPCKVTEEYIHSLIEWGKNNGVPIREIYGYPWIEAQYWPKIINYNTRICEGDALLFTVKPPDSEKIPDKLPGPSGFLGDKLKKSDIGVLSTLLEEKDIYVYDDFVNCLFVTKNQRIHDNIIDKVKKIKNSQQDAPADG